jgi:hypothetical protein
MFGSWKLSVADDVYIKTEAEAILVHRLTIPVCILNYYNMRINGRDRRIMIVLYLNLQLHVPITTKVVSSNPVHGKEYSIQHYVIKFVSDL